MAMKRTQIYVPEQVHAAAKILAKREDKPLAELFRLYIEGGIRHDLHKKQSGGLKRLGELGITGGPKDLSTNLDAYLYGGKK